MCPGPSGDELSIWDSKESEFTSGLEYEYVYEYDPHFSKLLASYTLFVSSSEPINDLDWTSTPDFQSILAVGFAQHVVLLCQQRMTYFEETPAWGILGRVDIGQ